MLYCKAFTLVILGLFLFSLGCHAVTLKSGRTIIDLDTADGKARLTGISDRDNGYSFLKGKSLGQSLWTIDLRRRDGDEKTAVIIDESKVELSNITRSKNGKRVVMTWIGLPAADEANALDVTVTVSALKDSMTDWRIDVKNRSKKLGLWFVKFPRIVGLSVGKTGQAAVPFGFGQVYDDPVHDPEFANIPVSAGDAKLDIYPNGLYSMQFASLSDEGSCLYLATHDPKAYLKRMRFAHAQDSNYLLYEIIQMPPNMGVPGQNYTQPYSCIVGALPGDWVNAAKFYRKWVLANSEWMKGKKPLAQRTDMPEWLKRMPYWVGFHGMTDDVMSLIEADVKNAGVPAAVHMYHWHQIQFDHRYPEFWPPLPNTRGYVDRLHSLGAKVMPYINLHLMDKLCDSWKTDDASRYTALSPDGTANSEIEDANRQMTPMCPGTAYWQNRFDDLTVKLVRDLDVDGIYCDQVAAIRPTPCFNPDHGHPVGGGNYWVEGHGKQVANIRRAAASVKKDVFFTTESAAEPHDFDIYLRCNEGAPFLSPIWQMVYSGYRLSFGFYFYEEREWMAKLATQYLWGVQIGWAGQHDPAKNPENSRFERECATARYAASDYLALGEMLREPKLTGDFARHKTTWRNFGTEIPIDWPSVKASLWKAPDGSLGLALVNLHSEAQDATFEIDRKEAGIGNGPVKLSALYPANLGVDADLSGGSIKSTVTLPARSAVMLVLRPMQ